MRKLYTIPALLILMALSVFALTGCGLTDGTSPQAAEDEIMLKIRLDLKEDIGLLMLDTRLGEAEASGGISNADKSMLKRDDVLYWTLSKRDYDDSAEVSELTVRFRVLTEYCAPNYDNIYPEEAVRPLDPVSFTAEFGRTYSLTITGDRVNGYRAALDQP